MLKRYQLLLILSVACGLAALPAFAGPSPLAPVGVVVAAQRAVIGQTLAVDGSSLYDGDRISTDANGAMRLRFGASQMVLGGNAIVTLHKTDAGVSATLLRGNVRFVSAPGTLLELRTLNTVAIRSKSGQPVTGQLSLVGPSTFEVGSIKGDLVVSVNGSDRVVTESNAYRVNLEDPGTPDGSSNSPTLAAGKSLGVWIPIALIIAGTAAALAFVFMSPSAPGPPSNLNVN